MFVAALPPEDVVEDLEAFWEPRRADPSARGVRWTRPEQWHLTLAFCADVPDRALDALGEGLAAAAARRQAFTLRVAGGGAFPHPSAAKVLWAGVAGAGNGGGADHPDGGAGEPDRLGELGELGALARGCRNAAARAGAPPDGAAFHPHLTLARLGRSRDVLRWVRVLDTYAGPSWRVEEVALVASHLRDGQGGRPRHEVLARFALGDG